MGTLKWVGRVCFAAMLAGATLEGAAAESRRVLLLHSYGPYFQPWSAIAGQFREDLIRRSPFGIDLYEASLQSERAVQSENPGPFLDYLAALFRGGRPDLIVALGGPAARFFRPHRVELFPTTPLLIAAADERTFSDDPLTGNDAAVAVRIEEAKYIENILQVLPQTASIAVAIGDSPLERFWVNELRRSFKPFEGRVAFEWWNDLPLDDMLKRAASLPPRSAIFYASVRVDAEGVPQEDDRALAGLREVANAPMFSYVDTTFGHGTVGGPLISTRGIAHRSASAAIRILSGETPSSVKTPTLGPSAPMFDWRELQRWNISEAQLPPDSQISFRTPGAWQQYREQILAISLALLVQAALIFWLIYERRRRARAEVRSLHAMAELAHLNRAATAGELSASIAHEVNQPLVGIVMHANAALRWLAAEVPDINKIRNSLTKIVDASQNASDVIVTIRGMFRKSTKERTPVDMNGLILKVLAIARIDLQKHSVDLRTQLDPGLPPVTADEVQLQQVVMNLVMNAIDAMHTSKPRVLRVQTERTELEMARISIEDTGPGIDLSNLGNMFKPFFSTKPHGIGMGLSICHSIVQAHRGRIWVVPGPERGAVFQFELPVH